MYTPSGLGQHSTSSSRRPSHTSTTSNNTTTELILEYTPSSTLLRELPHETKPSNTTDTIHNIHTIDTIDKTSSSSSKIKGEMPYETNESTDDDLRSNHDYEVADENSSSDEENDNTTNNNTTSNNSNINSNSSNNKQQLNVSPIRQKLVYNTNIIKYTSNNASSTNNNNSTANNKSIAPGHNYDPSPLILSSIPYKQIFKRPPLPTVMKPTIGHNSDPPTSTSTNAVFDDKSSIVKPSSPPLSLQGVRPAPVVVPGRRSHYTTTNNNNNSNNNNNNTTTSNNTYVTNTLTNSSNIQSPMTMCPPLFNPTKYNNNFASSNYPTSKLTRPTNEHENMSIDGLNISNSYNNTDNHLSTSSNTTSIETLLPESSISNLNTGPKIRPAENSGFGHGRKIGHTNTTANYNHNISTNINNIATTASSNSVYDNNNSAGGVISIDGVGFNNKSSTSSGGVHAGGKLRIPAPAIR